MDGRSHEFEEQKDHDTVRDAVLAGEGFRTLRFWHWEINDLEAVIASIRTAAGNPPTLAASRPVPPDKREGE